jgi:hypothetical protein
MFVKADVGLIRVVDGISGDIKSKEKAVNLLFLSTGTLINYTGMSAILKSVLVHGEHSVKEE